MTEELSNHVDAVLDILNEIGIDLLSYDKAKNQCRFAIEKGANPSATVMDLRKLSFYCFSNHKKGNLYTLIMSRKGLNFPETLKWVAQKAGIKPSAFIRQTRLPFGGFYKEITQQDKQCNDDIRTYSDTILNGYADLPNLMFLNDGIDFTVQKRYGIRYDVETNRIVVPEYTTTGELCGIMGRLNDAHCEKEERWIPLLPCSRTMTLAGYHLNYSAIQQKQLVIVGESEKFPMQLSSFGCDLGLATCGCHISVVQERHIKGLFVPKIILAYDEGLAEDYVRIEAKKLLSKNQIYQNQVGYIWDDTYEILPKGSKASPSDFGKEKFVYLVKHKVRWIEREKERLTQD